MFKTRKLGFGLIVALGLLTAIPVSADEACQQTLGNIDKAMTTLTSLQQLLDQIDHRAVAAAAVDAPFKCPACGMMMPTKATASLTRAVKYNGKTYYCCAGCNMSATADKDEK